MKKILKIFKRLERVVLENLDFIDCIKKYDSDSTLFYLDPPYFGIDYYSLNKFLCADKFTEEKHYELYEILKNIKGKFVLSYNDNETIKNLYKDYNIIQKQATYSLRVFKNTGRKKAIELLIKNF